MSIIRFEAKPFVINTKVILLLPKSVSAKLPSRGQTMVKGSMNGHRFQTALEPDGKGSHWFEVDTLLSQIKAGNVIQLEIEPTKEWPEPKVPEEVKRAIAADPKAHALWESITPMAKWDWMRWINSTKNPDTYKKHIVVAVSKMKKGERRPCCFNRSMCTDQSVSKSGLLLAPTQIA